MTNGMYTVADLSALKAAYANGASEISFGNHHFKLYSIQDFEKLCTIMQNDINSAAAAGPAAVRQVRIYTNSGWGC